MRSRALSEGAREGGKSSSAKEREESVFIHC